jgi:hypothetical protein
MTHHFNIDTIKSKSHSQKEESRQLCSFGLLFFSALPLILHNILLGTKHDKAQEERKAKLKKER